MRFAHAPRRPAPDSIVPMINVVFLLLIFFLMSAQIAPPDPVAVTLPQAASDAPADGVAVLLLGADGALAMAGVGDVWAELEARPPEARVTIRADRDVAAVELARVMARLANLGLTRVDLAVLP